MPNDDQGTQNRYQIPARRLRRRRMSHSQQSVTQHPHRAAALLETEEKSKETETIIVVRNEEPRTDQIIVYKRGNGGFGNPFNRLLRMWRSFIHRGDPVQVDWGFGHDFRPQEIWIVDATSGQKIVCISSSLTHEEQERVGRL
jgi:hypothetical protein